MPKYTGSISQLYEELMKEIEKLSKRVAKLERGKDDSGSKGKTKES